MEATMNEILDFIDFSRKFCKPVKVTVFGLSEIDEFNQIEISSGNTEPVVSKIDSDYDPCTICIKKESGWVLIQDYHLEESLQVVEPVDNLKRNFVIECAV